MTNYEYFSNKIKQLNKVEKQFLQSCNALQEFLDFNLNNQLDTIRELVKASLHNEYNKAFENLFICAKEK